MFCQRIALSCLLFSVVQIPSTGDVSIDGERRIDPDPLLSQPEIYVLATNLDTDIHLNNNIEECSDGEDGSIICPR